MSGKKEAFEKFATYWLKFMNAVAYKRFSEQQWCCYEEEFGNFKQGLKHCVFFIANVRHMCFPYKNTLKHMCLTPAFKRVTFDS
jgi:hypothetical protein